MPGIGLSSTMSAETMRRRSATARSSARDLRPRQAARLGRAGRRHDRRVHAVDVDADVDVGRRATRRPRRSTSDPARIVDVVEDRRVQLRQDLGLFGREAADADLGERARAAASGASRRRGCAACPCRRRACRRARRSAAPTGPGYLRAAAETSGGVIECSPPSVTRNLSRADDLVGDALDLVDERLHLAEGQLHLRQREDADAVDVGAHLLVPQLHVRRGLQDLVRAVARAADVGGGAIDRAPAG